jgi:hypothetical protein
LTFRAGEEGKKRGRRGEGEIIEAPSLKPDT